MLWLRASLFVLASVPMVLGNLTRNGTCLSGIGPKDLSDLKFEDFAMPFGVNTLNNYCWILRDVYLCDGYANEKAIKSSKAVLYLVIASGYLMGFCDPEGYFYQEYRRNEECFAKVLPFYNRCVDSAKDQQVLCADTCPKDGSVENCKRESQFVFCMAENMRKVCGKPDPGLYYLLVQKTTHFFEIHCTFPELLHVRQQVSDMMTELFYERKKNREKQSLKEKSVEKLDS